MNKTFNKITIIFICLVFIQIKSQGNLNEKCNENLNFKLEFFNNIKIIDNLIYTSQNAKFHAALKFISQYSHVSAESMLNYARTYPGGIYEDDRKIWIKWYEENKCKNIQFKKNASKEIYFKNGKAYDKLTNKLYTGIAQNFKNSGNLQSEEYFQDGALVKFLLYYNIKSSQIVCEETQYNISSGKKIKNLRFSSDGKNRWETKFDSNERKSEYNFYVNENINIHQEFLNGKKNGTWYCYNDNSFKCETEYKNGKKIRDCK